MSTHLYSLSCTIPINFVVSCFVLEGKHFNLFFYSYLVNFIRTECILKLHKVKYFWFEHIWNGRIWEPYCIKYCAETFGTTMDLVLYLSAPCPCHGCSREEPKTRLLPLLKPLSFSCLNFCYNWQGSVSILKMRSILPREPEEPFGWVSVII